MRLERTREALAFADCIDDREQAGALAEVEQAEAVLREARDLRDDMGVDDIDPRLRYVVAQISRERLAEFDAALAAFGSGEGDPA